MAFRKIKAGLVNADIEQFVGEIGNLFFDIDTGELRLSDGSTPGGVTVSGGSGGSNYTLPTATTTIKGGVKIDGTTIAIDNSVISVGTVPYTSISGAPTVPTAVSQLTNDTGFITGVSWDEVTGKPSLFSGSYADLTNKPTAVSAFTNDSGYLTSSSLTWNNISSKPSFAAVATSGDYADLTNKPTLFSGSYVDLTNKPTLFSGSYTDLTNKPTLTTTLAALTDVATAGAITGQVLTYDSITQRWIPGGAGGGATGALGYYGSFYDVTATQANAGASSANLISIGGVYESNGVSIQNGSKITFSYAGTYSIVFSLQFVNDNASEQDVSVWLKTTVDGVTTNVADSTVVYTIDSDTGSLGKLVAINPFIITVAAGEQIQIYWQSPSTDVYLKTIAAQTSPAVPRAPAVILTVEQTSSIVVPDSIAGNAATATKLLNARTINNVSFDGSSNITVTANTTNTLTIGTGLSGTSFNGSSAVTIAVDSTVALRADTLHIGTTDIALNRASASQTLTGVSIDGNAATVTNGVYTNGSYSNPSWITSLAYSKLTGAPSLFSGSYTDLTNKPTIYTSAHIGTTDIDFTRASASQTLTGVSIDGNAGTVTNGLYSTGSYANPAWITSLAYSKLTGAPTVPTNVSQLTNDSGYATLTGAETLTNKTLTLPTIGGTGATFNGSSSGTTVLKASSAAGTTTITLPPRTGTVITSGDTGTVTNTMLEGNIANAKLFNSSVTIGSTVVALGTTTANLEGLNSVTATNFIGNATTVTNGVYTNSIGVVTDIMLAGSIANNKLANSSITVNGTSISLGSSATITAAAGTLTGTTLNSTVVTSSLTSVGTLTGLTVQSGSGINYVARFKGSTGGDQFAIGVSSTAGYGAGNDVLNSAGTAYAPYTISASTMTFKTGSTTPATAFSIDASGNVTFTNTVTGSVSGNAGTVTNGVYTTDTGTVTNTMLAGSIANNKLSNSSITVNGTSISLGSSGTVTAAAGTLTGTTLNSTVVSSSLTSVGTLTGLTVTSTSSSNSNVVSITGVTSPANGSTATWNFQTEGSSISSYGSRIQFPDSTYQYTAWTGTAAAGTLTGTTLNSTVVTSSLTSVGTLTSLSSGAITTTGTLALNASGGITTNQTTFPLVNTTATTVNFAGAATAVNIGASTGTTTVNNMLKVNYTGSTDSSIQVAGNNTKGGAGYHDFLKVTNTGQTNPNKFFRLTSTGTLQILNSAYSANVFSVTDDGFIAINASTGTTNSVPVNNAIAMNSNSYIYDDGNYHITAKTGQIWLNSNDGSAVSINQQVPSGTAAGGLKVTGPVNAQSAYYVRTGWNSAIDTEITVDDYRFRISNQGGIFPQVISNTAGTKNSAWTVVAARSGSAINQTGSTGTLVANNAWTSLYTSAGMDSAGDTYVATLQDKAQGRIYRVTFMRSDNGSTTGYNIIAERLL